MILIADPVCYSRWHKRCSRDRLKMQMTHFFFHDHDATQSECAHRLLRTNNYLSPESQGRWRGPRIWGVGDTWFSGTTKGKGGSVVFIRVFETGNYRKLTTNEGGSLEYYRALRDQVSCGKIKIHGLLTQLPPPYPLPSPPPPRLQG